MNIKNLKNLLIKNKNKKLKKLINNYLKFYYLNLKLNNNIKINNIKYYKFIKLNYLYLKNKLKLNLIKIKIIKNNNNKILNYINKLIKLNNNLNLLIK